MINYENLKRAKELLKTIPEDRFSMDDFITCKNPDLQDVLNPCDSVCCVIGHCVVLDIETNLKKYSYSYSFDYGGWSYSFFGFEYDSDLWNFLFSEIWVYVDNTLKGAIKRIEYVLNNRDFAKKLDNTPNIIDDSDYKEWYKLYK